MKSFFTLKMAVFMTALFSFGTVLQAQNVVWEEQFAGGLGDWEVVTISMSNDSTEWRWIPNGRLQQPGLTYAATAAINSPSAANGAVVMNYEHMMTGGSNANVPPFPYTDYQGDLISPTIDMSGVSGPIGLEFNQLFRRLNAVGGTPFASFSVSNDDGVTWSNPIEVNDLVGPNDNPVNNKQSYPIPTSLGLQGSATVKIKFTYAGDFYYWALDDIKITERTARDMRANQNWYAIAPNAVTPAPMVDEFYFVCDIENIGGQDETGVNLNVKVRNAVNGNLLYEADQPYGTIISDSLAENVVFGAFTPPSVPGLYRGTYTVSADSMDSNPANNTIDFEFQISELSFQKEIGSTRNVAPAADNSFSYGNAFFIPTSGYAAKDVTFGVSNADDLAGQFITLKLIKVLGDLNEDNQINVDEYELVTFNGYTFDGSENDALLTIPIDIDGNAIPLDAGFNYLVTMEYQDVNQTAAFYLSADNFNYGAMNLGASANGKERFGSLLDVGLDGEFSIIGFGYDLVPVVRLTLEDLSGTRAELSADNKVQLYPNPTTDQLTIDLDLVNRAEELEVRIVDIAGKVLYAQQFEQIQKDRLTFRVGDFNTGAYIARIITKDGVRSLPFVVQK